MADADNEAMTILIMGVIGVSICFVLAPVAWSRGNSYARTCKALEVQPNPMATVGRILGIIGTIPLILIPVFVLISALR